MLVAYRLEERKESIDGSVKIDVLVDPGVI